MHISGCLTKTDRILRYEGSLTTEPYSENVTWMVFRDLKGLPEALMRSLLSIPHKNCQTGTGKIMVSRPTNSLPAICSR